MRTFTVKNTPIYINEEDGNFSIYRHEVELSSPVKIQQAPNYNHSLYECMSFCLEISDVCNLRCSYCFNQGKTGKRMSIKDAERSLDLLFSEFPNAEKYFIDLSGAGEPLMNLSLIDAIAQYAKQKSDEIDREVTVTLVSNGTLLSKPVAEHLQKKSILFGVSIDGNKENHDTYRVYANGRGSFDDIVKNIKSIKHRQYVGCAITITKTVFSLLDVLKELSEIFMTLSVKPVRSGTLGLDEESCNAWLKEYEILEAYLEHGILNKDLSLIFKLLNGDDFFGKFILRSFLNIKALSRCDSGIGRIAVSTEGKFYPCPALIGSNLVLGDVESGFDSESAKKIYRSLIERKECEACPFRFACGGNSLAEDKKQNPVMCKFKKGLILLAMLLEEKTRNYPEQYTRIIDFCLEKVSRTKENADLRRYRNDRPNISFTTAKQQFDQSRPMY